MKFYASRNQQQLLQPSNRVYTESQVRKETAVDNFDAHIHSSNGILSTHSLAMILVQPSGTHEDPDPDTIVRLKWQGDMHMLMHHSWMDVHFVQ